MTDVLPVPGRAAAPADTLPLEDLSMRTRASTLQSQEQNLINETGLPPVDRGKQAWQFVASACALEIIIWGFSFSFGIFAEHILSHDFAGNTPVAVSAIGTTALALQYSSLLVLFNAYRKWPEAIIPCTYAAIGLCVVSLFVSSFVHSVWALVLLQGVLYGIGAGVVYAPAVIWLYDWFSARRGIAGGIIFAGTGIGGFALPLILGAMLEKIGYAWTIRAWALITLSISGFAMLGLKPRLPLPPKGAPRSSFLPKNVTWWRDPVFAAVMLTNFIQSLGYLSVSLYLSLFTTSLGYAPLYGQIALAIFNAAGVAGQIGVGWICDSRPYTWVMLSSALASAVLAFALWGFASNIPTVFAFAVIFGGISGGFSSSWPAAATDIAGKQPQQAGLVFAFLALMKAVAAIAGPTIAGTLYDPTAIKSAYGAFGFARMTIFVGSTMLATCVGSIATQAARKKRQ